MRIVETQQKPNHPAPPPVWTAPLIDVVINRIAQRCSVSRDHARVILSLSGLGPKETRQ